VSAAVGATAAGVAMSSDAAMRALVARTERRGRSIRKPHK